MDLAKGEYLLLLANDDALKDETTLGRMAELLRAHPAADVMLTNFEDFGSGVVTRRVDRTAMARLRAPRGRRRPSENSAS